MDPHAIDARKVVIALPLLFVVLGAEVAAYVLAGSLPQLAHLSDVAGDFTAFMVVLIAAVWAFLLDKLGREHTRSHPEEIVAAVLNILVLAGGFVYAGWQTVEGFSDQRTVEGQWWLMAGPLIALLAYWFINILLKDANSTVSMLSLQAHVSVDVAAAAVLIVVTGVTLVYQAGWVNSAGSLVILAIIFWMFVSLLRRVGESLGRG